MKKTAEQTRINFLSRSTSHPGEVVAGHPTSPDVVAAATLLRDALVATYGSDFSFQVMGQGHVLAANNNAFGKVSPVCQPK